MKKTMIGGNAVYMTKKELIRKLADEVRTMDCDEYERLEDMLGATNKEKCISVIREILDTIEKYEHPSMRVNEGFKECYMEEYRSLTSGGHCIGTAWECLMDLGDLRSGLRRVGFTLDKVA